MYTFIMGVSSWRISIIWNKSCRMENITNVCHLICKVPFIFKFCQLPVAELCLYSMENKKIYFWVIYVSNKILIGGIFFTMEILVNCFMVEAGKLELTKIRYNYLKCTSGVHWKHLML